MKKLPLLTLAALSAVGILWACGGGSSDDDDSVIPYDAGPDVPIRLDTGIDGPDPAAGQGTAFCDATLGVVRDAIKACCTTSEANGLTLDLYKNIDAYVTACGTKLENSIGQHRTSPTPQDFDACENGYKSLFGADGGSCGTIDTFRIFDVVSPSCATAFTGKGVTNDPCGGDFDCAQGQVCIGYSDTSDGKCQAAAPQDGQCGAASGSGVVAPNLVMGARDSCSSGLYCTGGTCQPTTADNGTCTTNDQCSSGNCLMGHCDEARSGGSKSINGDGCITSDDCMTGFFCDIPGNVAALEVDAGAPPYATGTCAASVADGQSCNTSFNHQCLSNSCSTNLCDKYCSFP